MRIEYPADTTTFAAAVETVPVTDLIREAVARQLKVNPDLLSDEDYARVEGFSLADSDVTDLAPIHHKILSILSSCEERRPGLSLQHALPLSEI